MRARGSCVDRRLVAVRLTAPLDEMYVKLNGEMVYLWRAVDQEGEILESYITRTRDKAAALTLMKKALKRHGSPEAITTDGLRSYQAAMKELGKRRQAGGRTLGQQPRRKQSSVVPTTRAGNAQVQADEVTSEVRQCPRQRPQPLQSRTPSR
jgi:putative transposase